MPVGSKIQFIPDEDFFSAVVLPLLDLFLGREELELDKIFSPEFLLIVMKGVAVFIPVILGPVPSGRKILGIPFEAALDLAGSGTWFEVSDSCSVL